MKSLDSIKADLETTKKNLLKRRYSMKLQMFSIYDVVSKLYARPFFDINEATAKRNLRAAINDPKAGFANTIDDYRLYYIGDFDDQTGTFTVADHSPVYVDTFVNIGGVHVQHDTKTEG